MHSVCVSMFVYVSLCMCIYIYVCKSLYVYLCLCLQVFVNKFLYVCSLCVEYLWSEVTDLYMHSMALLSLLSVCTCILWLF